MSNIKAKRGNKKTNATKLVKYSKNQIHSTTDYSMFKTNKNNRGLVENNGIEESRKQRYIELIKQRLFIFVFGLVWVNLKMEVIDGHHKLEACKAQKKPVYFVILDDDLVNPKAKKKKDYDKDLSAVTADLNDTNSSWSNKKHFECALNGGWELAVIINDYIWDISEATGIATNKIPTNFVYAMVKNDVNHFRANKKVVVREYGNDADIINAMTQKVKDDIALFIELTPLLSNVFETGMMNKIWSVIYQAYWNVDQVSFFKKDRFVRALKTYKGSKFGSGKLRDIKDFVQDLYNDRYSNRKSKTDRLFK
jgi:hypothetical protein